MSGHGEGRPEGLARRIEPSLRSIVLAVASRATVGLLVIAGVALVTLPRWTPSVPATVVDGDPRQTMTGETFGEAVTPGGAMTTAGLLAAVDRETRSVRARIVELEIVPGTGTRAEVRARIDTPGGDASSVAQVVAALDQARLDAPRVRTVTPVPDGARLEVTAGVERASAPLSLHEGLVPEPHSADLSVALTELVQRSGAELRRLEVRDPGGAEDGGTVRLAVRAAAEPLVALLDALEREHTAPLRFTAWRVEAIGDELELAATFVRRSAVSGRDAGATS